MWQAITRHFHLVMFLDFCVVNDWTDIARSVKSQSHSHMYPRKAELVCRFRYLLRKISHIRRYIHICA